MRQKKMLLAGIVMICTLSFLSSVWAIEDVRHTKHNLSANTNVGAVVTGAGAGEVCIFCHTPHGGQSSQSDPNAPYSDAAPLWNRVATNPGGTYTMYTSPNFDGLNVAAKPQGVSLACLSCHDGTIALDALANYPGSGSTDNISFNGTVRVDANGKMINDTGYTFPMLGTDLSNDHPISMEVPTADPQFVDLTFTTKPGGIQAIQRSTPTDAKLPIDVRDMIRTYPTPNGSTGKYIECASCHNPHEASRPGDPSYDPTVTTQAASGVSYASGEVVNSRFLRFPSYDPTLQAADVQTALMTGDRNAGSLICLTCHQK